MITNVIIFLSSISTTILVGVVIIALNVKYKNSSQLNELSLNLASMVTIFNTNQAYPNLTQKFAKLQEAYYSYKQAYNSFSSEQNETLELLGNLKKLSYLALGIWLIESILIVMSGKNIFEHAVASGILFLLILLFLKFNADIRAFSKSFFKGDENIPNPDFLLTPSHGLANVNLPYLAPQLSLNILEAGIALELRPPENLRKYLKKSSAEESESQAESNNYDFSSYLAKGQLNFAFNYNFKGQLVFLTKNGSDGSPFSFSNDYFKTGFSNIYSIEFPYHTPVHLLEKIDLLIYQEDSNNIYGRITFLIPQQDDLPGDSLLLTQSTARKNDEDD